MQQQQQSDSEKTQEEVSNDENVGVIQPLNVKTWTMEDAVTQIQIDHQQSNDDNSENTNDLNSSLPMPIETDNNNVAPPQSTIEQEQEQKLDPIPIDNDNDNEQEDKSEPQPPPPPPQSNTPPLTPPPVESESKQVEKVLDEGGIDNNNSNEQNNQNENSNQSSSTATPLAEPSSASIPSKDTNLDPDDNFDPNAPCGVCWKTESYDHDAIIYCDGCNVPLHQTCYCISQVPTGDYYCKVCSFQISKAGIPSQPRDFLGRRCKCSICQLRFRSKKLAYSAQKMDLATNKKQKWCHLVCAQYVSETWFDETNGGNQTLDGVCNVDGIREQRYLGSCEYCGRSKGAKVFCSLMGCTKRFHASCGLVNGCVLEDIAAPTEPYSNRVVYCPDHADGALLSTALERKRWAESRDISINGNRNNLGWGKTWDAKMSEDVNYSNHSRRKANNKAYEQPSSASEEEMDYQTFKEKQVKKRKKKTPKKRATKPRKKKSPKQQAPKRKKLKKTFLSSPPPLQPIKRGGFFHSTRSTGPRRIGNGPSPHYVPKSAKKKFAQNHVKKTTTTQSPLKRKEPPQSTNNMEPAHKKQKINNNDKVKKNVNPNMIPKRTMPKYSANPSVLPSSRDNEKNQQSAKELIERSAPKRFEQKGKVRFIKPNMPTTNNRNVHRMNVHNQSSQLQTNGHNESNNTYHDDSYTNNNVNMHEPMHPNERVRDPVHNAMSNTNTNTPGTPYKVFPKRPNQIWNTTMIQSNDNDTSIKALQFGVSFVWRAGCQIDWPFEDMKVPINCSWKKDFGEIEKYMKEIRPGGKKQHLSHHWMLCEIHPYSTNDIVSYGDFCNYYKDLNKVSAAMCKSVKHEHLLFYLCPPDENVLPEQYLDDIFHCKLPKGLLWCLIFVKNLNLDHEKSGKGVAVNNNVNKSANVKDPRKRKKRSKEKEKKVRRKEKEKEKEKEKSVSLGVEVDGGKLLGMLGNLEDSLKDQADIGKAEDMDVILTGSQEF